MQTMIKSTRVKICTWLAICLLVSGLMLTAVLHSHLGGYSSGNSYIASSVANNTNRVAYLGGMPIGLSVKSNGVIVVDLEDIETEFGKTLPKTGLLKGDIITHINDKNIETGDDIDNALKEYSTGDKQLKITILRGEKEKTLSCYPIKEIYTNYYKLGVMTKNYAEGVGTVTYIKPSGEFASLGHPILSSDGDFVIPCSGGNVFNCKIVGLNKGKKGAPGELRGTFVGTNAPVGVLKQNSRFGVFGRLNNVIGSELVPVANRHEVKLGKAEIITTIGDKTERYDIKIVKAVNQSSASEKGIVFKVVDKRLIAASGGIVQGMSGSPIIQNGKLIGAVTHVFVSNPTKAYGVYIDWMYC